MSIPMDDRRRDILLELRAVTFIDISSSFVSPEAINVGMSIPMDDKRRDNRLAK